MKLIGVSVKEDQEEEFFRDFGREANKWVTCIIQECDDYKGSTSINIL